MKRDPLPAHPDNAALGVAILQVEECVHETGAALDRKLQSHRRTLNKHMQNVDARLALIEKQTKGVRQVVGVDDDGKVVRKTPMLMSSLGFFSTLSGVVFGLFLVVQLGNALWPSISMGLGEAWQFALSYGAPAQHK